MYQETNHKGYKIMCEWGYAAEKDSKSVVLSIDPKVEVSRGRMVKNLVRHRFNAEEKGSICSLDLSITYSPRNSSELIEQGEIAPQENLEQEIYSASLSAHSTSPQYLDQVVKRLKERLKWINTKKDDPEMELPMQMALDAHKEMIDSEIARSN